LGGAFSCFGFRCSRLLRFCPLAIAERPSDKGCVFWGGRLADGLKAVFSRYSLVTFLVAADAVLWRVIPCRQSGHNSKQLGSCRRDTEPPLHPDGLSDTEEMRCDFRQAPGVGVSRYGHAASRSFASASSSSAASIGTICLVGRQQ
jgi:hypothetical protein